MIIHLNLIRFTLLFLMLSSTQAIEISSDSFTLTFSEEGRPESCRRKTDGAEFLSKGGGEGFYLKGLKGLQERFTHLVIAPDGRLVAATADGSKKITLRVTRGFRELVLRIENVEGVDPARFESLYFNAHGNDQLRVLPLDYMTVAESGPDGVMVKWSEFWHRAPQNPLGGFVLYECTGDKDEDETLLRLWVEQKLPHPKVDGAWTLERARSWMADWQRRFADRTQLILAGQSLEELREGLDFASHAGLKQLYLFTDTWRTDAFWPVVGLNWEVNTRVFPRGEADLRAFSDEVRARGMYLALHYVSGGIGKKDPLYVGQKPDRRLAGWGAGKLGVAAGVNDKQISFIPGPGVTPPSERALPASKVAEWNLIRVGNEIIQFDSIERVADGSWLLKACKRGQGSTVAAAHSLGEDAAGLFAAYGQNFVPDNDSTLLNEVAENFAGLLNHCRVEHVEFDGAEIHMYNGGWGYRKFATLVYEALDHPTTAHDSAGSRPGSWFEYRFNSSQRLMAGSCAYSHGNYCVPMALATPSRPATTLLDTHFTLSQGNIGGALGISKPEPMFGVTPAVFKEHGLTDLFLDALATWTEVCALLTPEQRAQLNAGFSAPKGDLLFNHHLMSAVVPVVRKVNDHYEITPTRVLTRKSGDILWQTGQEHGAISPRQFFKPGESIMVENPDGTQPVKFILHVLPAFDFNAAAVEATAEAASTVSGRTATEVFTGGNDARGAAKSLASAGNVLLQPRGNQRIQAAGATTVRLEGGALVLEASNPGPKSLRETEQLPGWGLNVDLSARRGLGLWVTGDESGAILLIQIGHRDYVVPIDFIGRRYVEIPNGEVSWASGIWGWRMGTKSNNYAKPGQIKIGFGQLPSRSSASVKVEQLTALGEISAPLVNPMVRVGSGQIRVQGTVPTGCFLEYDGGNEAVVYDEDWRRRAALPVRAENALAPTGPVTMGVQVEPSGSMPWIDAQFITTGSAMIVKP
ncbi:MAG: hypothetical protein WCH43_06745 [Verrucomicrobiota bacterium]